MFFTSVAVMSRVSRKMWLALLVCQLSLLGARGQIPAECVTSDTNRPPENSDIMVYCGTEHMDLSVFLCPVYQALYNESLMVLNNELNNAECFGEADFTVDPPVLKFSFPINESTTSSCGNDFNIINQVGTGAFADFSNVQYVNISGTVNSIDPSASMITYRPQLIYMFSCLYPMQYIINNTELGVAGVNVAIKDNNGSFISTLSLELYEDDQFQNALTMPTTGLQLKTKIYVAVRATNLTDRFNVLLDRCYATTSPYPAFDSFYDLFIGCTRDDQTEVILNGESQVAHFSFEAFRFVEHKNRTVSTFYLHCVTRLCEVSACEALKPVCSVGRRRRREVEDVLANATVTSPPIMVAKKSRDFQTNTASYGVSRRPYSDLVVAVIINIVILSHFRF
ncbi:zona pellucida-like domain-containing protein 1 [Hippocampus comes]|uniref:zona pellucida-like domain-containing protein 1 n=1 Tax=Hippocampus comes TaxID=109280 RepID=UPI00094E9E57|nr:PREDICTED: zona pellucida-like domain-containing protein 1 [Hippocampus comes]